MDHLFPAFPLRHRERRVLFPERQLGSHTLQAAPLLRVRLLLILHCILPCIACLMMFSSGPSMRQKRNFHYKHVHTCTWYPET